MKVMRKKLVNQKRDVMKSWSQKDLVDHIRNYHNQELLDYDEDGVKRDLPIGMIAKNVEERNYDMTPGQYYTLLDGFTKITTPEMKVVGVSFRKPDVQNFKMDLVHKKGVVSKYDLDYILEPEPENEFDPNAVRVSIQDKNGILQQIGYVSKDFLEQHPIKETMVIEGSMDDHSNGHFSNLSYNISFDTEILDERIESNKVTTYEEYEQLSFDFDVMDDDLDIEAANEDIQLTLDDLMDLTSDNDTLEQ